MIAVIDTETTGLDPAVHEIVSIGAIIVDDRLMPRAAIQIHCHPERPDWQAVADPEALRVNGYDHDVWQQRGAVPQSVAAQAAMAVLADHCPAGHVVAFDLAFIGALFRCHDLADPFADCRHAIDTASVAAVLLGRATGSVAGSRSLAAVLGLLGVGTEGHHSALWDAVASLHILREASLSLGQQQFSSQSRFDALLEVVRSLA